MSKDIDVIIHNGAYVHHMHSYKSLKSENVDSTIELLKLAILNKPKSFHYVSTIGANRVDKYIRNGPV